jgi:protease IV
VVTSKFNLEKLNDKLGYKVETISRGRFAEVLSSSRGFTPDEEQFFADNAMRAYKSFTSKAAMSRNMTIDALLEVAQGRVWTGKQARNRGLVDEVRMQGQQTHEISLNVSIYCRLAVCGQR